MPRAKVDPKHRQRADKACLACRSSKKRCSGTFPCTKCVRTGRADSCAASVQLRTPGLSSTRVRNATVTRDSDLHDAVAPPTLRCATPPLQSPIQPSVHPGSLSPEAPHRTHPRMLRNLQGERVYVGKAASLSFLQLLRDTVTQYIGPSQFSHSLKREDMLEAETPQDAMPPFQESDLDENRRQTFLLAYKTATSGFVDALSDEETALVFQEPTAFREPAKCLGAQTALGDIMIAIGAQCAQSDNMTTRAERFFFSRAQTRAFTGMLENPSLEIVRLFLLMSFYMLGACRRNAAFMYLGVAVRAAVALGLHIPDSSAATPEQQQQRVCIWMSLCILDLLISSILGRPPATACLRAESSGNMEHGPAQIRPHLVASYRMSRILDEIIVRLYSEKAASADAAASILGKLTRWSDSLPGSLLAPPDADCARAAAQQHIIGSLHIACSYHFAVIIVTRPFLISVLGIRLARLQPASTGSLGLPPEALQDDPAHAQLASACVDSALYMIQTCMEVHESDLLLGNMCILKAFVFAAALVLGFSLFAQREVNTAVEDAFHGAIRILHTLSQQSAQAGHYHEILTLLKSAIAEQRQRLVHRSPQKNRYVSKLFSLKGDRDRDRDHAGEEVTGSVRNEASGTTTPSQGNLLDSLMDGGLFCDWDGMELPSWDSFPFTEDVLS
ncbi:fungal-specific transcription factor domain-domain-containing protein [Aspergillus taichungensis]|uniref:Fungal-specific transcription factor domain-domain-containing protein n=1 Tax=Aspergillus taichungensis TaxID=482145 RepID=A0A2J5HCT8_9EURO|nr:fungal-specific transcription factor domain-domain-containing protein [Aspergillus taichungensis]